MQVLRVFTYLGAPGRPPNWSNRLPAPLPVTLFLSLFLSLSLSLSFFFAVNENFPLLLLLLSLLFLFSFSSSSLFSLFSSLSFLEFLSILLLLLKTWFLHKDAPAFHVLRPFCSGHDYYNGVSTLFFSLSFSSSSSFCFFFCLLSELTFDLYRGILENSERENPLRKTAGYIAGFNWNLFLLASFF